MKRNVSRVAGLVLALALLTVSSAHAGWVSDQLNWVRSNSTDGLYFKSQVTTGAASKVDTTESFTLDDADFPPIAVGLNGTTLDTVVVAKLIIYGDSTAASTINFKDASVSIQANAGSNSAGWQAARSVATLNTDGQKYIEIPIYASNNAVSKQLYIDRTGDFSLFGNSFRAILTEGATGSAVPAMKVKLVKFKK